MQKTIFIFFALILLSQLGFGQRLANAEEYILQYKDLAIKEMLRTGVPASITLAQGIHETSAGESTLLLKSNNHFGIKCKNNWAGESVNHDDDERSECFRKYENAEASYKDHSDFLRNNKRYAFLFNYNPTDYESWAMGLKKAGYATNVKYAHLLIHLIEDHHLNDYSLIALGLKTDNTSKPFAHHYPKNSTQASAVLPLTNGGEASEDEIQKLALQYPVGVFKINETKVIYVSKGVSFLSIAREHNILLTEMFGFNDMQPHEISNKSQLIYLQRKRKRGHHEFHIVKEGESLWDIAQQEAIRLESLLSYNGLAKNQQPAIGEKLYLQSKTSSAPRLVLRTDYNMYESKPDVRN